MKLHALMIAAALAFAGTAFAQSPNGTEKAPAGTSASATHSMSSQHHKHVAKAKRMHARHHASLSHHGQNMHARARTERHEMHARAHMERHHMHARAEMGHNTRAMGAGPSSPSTDLNSRSRDNRMNSAYQDWQRLQARR